jgi:HlyD family secretion protein
MNRVTRKRIVLIALALVVLALLVYAFLPKPIPVQTAQVRTGPLHVTVEEEGVTDVTDRYAVTAPVIAFLRRIELEPGDPVSRGAPVARLEPPRTPILDPGARIEAAARVRAAQATARNARVELERMERLAAGGSATRQQLDQAASEASHTAAELAAAEAVLRRTEGNANLPVQHVLTAPAAGKVLAVRRESEGQVNPGDTLVVIGNARNLEVRVDVLSEDAVRIHPGTSVQIDQWGGPVPLEAVVHASNRRVLRKSRRSAWRSSGSW